MTSGAKAPLLFLSLFRGAEAPLPPAEAGGLIQAIRLNHSGNPVESRQSGMNHTGNPVESDNLGWFWRSALIQFASGMLTPETNLR